MTGVLTIRGNVDIQIHMEGKEQEDTGEDGHLQLRNEA